MTKRPRLINDPYSFALAGSNVPRAMLAADERPKGLPSAAPDSYPIAGSEVETIRPVNRLPVEVTRDAPSGTHAKLSASQTTVLLERKDQ